jgi:PIN domain nuclease of toxin-antitoxin system
VLYKTHALICKLFDDQRLSTPARKVIAASDNETPVSSASAWQISTKHQFGKRLRADDVPMRLPAYLHKARSRCLVFPRKTRWWQAIYQGDTKIH